MAKKGVSITTLPKKVKFSGYGILVRDSVSSRIGGKDSYSKGSVRHPVRKTGRRRSSRKQTVVLFIFFFPEIRVGRRNRAENQANPIPAISVCPAEWSMG